MDYSWFLHKMRKFATLTVSFFIVVLCIFILNFLRSAETAVDTRTQDHNLWVFELAEKARDTQGPGPGPGLCMELCELDVSFDPKCRDMASPTTYLHSILSDEGRLWDDSVGTPHILVDDQVSCPSNADPSTVWRSPSCTAGPGENVSAKVLYNFTNPRAVKCLQASKKDVGGQGPGGPGGPGDQNDEPAQPMPMKVYGCDAKYVASYNSSGLFDADGAEFKDSTYCIRYDDVILEEYDRQQPIKLREDCLFPVTLEAATLAVQEGEDKLTGNRMRCFCLQQIAEDPFLRIPGYRDTPAAQLCKDFIWNQSTQMGIRVGGVVAVMVINNILLVLFAYFDGLGRYQTATDLAASQVFNLFFATLVNTAIVYNLIGINTYTSDRGFLGALRFGKGPYDDLSGLWFVTIGNMMVITIACQIACSVALPVIWVLTVDPFLRYIFVKDTHSQELLNEYHVLPEWTLSLRVAETLVVVFCVFMYSAGFPLLYLFGALYCLCAFWADKYALLRGSRKPPGYTKSAIESAVKMCPWAIMFHLLFAIWLFGNQDMFPSDWGGMRGFSTGLVGYTESEYDSIMDIIARSGFDVRGDQYWEYLKARMSDASRMAAEPSLWLLIFMLAWYALNILHWLFRPCVGNRVGQACEFVLKAVGVWQDAEETKETLTQAKFADDQKTLLSYRLAANPNYEEAVLALKFDPEVEEPEKEKKQPKRRNSGAGVSFSAMEENLERAVAQKVHEAENFVAKAIDGLKVFSRGQSRANVSADGEAHLEQAKVGERVQI